MTLDISKLHLHWAGGTYKGKKYKTYSLARSVRENGRNRHVPVVKLGKLEPEEVEWWRNLLKCLKSSTPVIACASDIVTTAHWAFGDIAIADAMWDFWKLDKVFHSCPSRRADVALEDIARILTVNRCIDPESKLGVTRWLPTTTLGAMHDLPPEKINRSRLFRDLGYIENAREALSDHLLKEYGKHFPDQLDHVYYDLSSTTFSGTKCLISKWGHCKEGYEEHVVLALLVTENGLPFYWEVLPGGTADAKTIAGLMQSCSKKFRGLKITAAFDRGFVSDDNLNIIESENIKYITAMDKSQIEKYVGDTCDFMAFSRVAQEDLCGFLQAKTDFELTDSQTWCKEIGEHNNRRYVLCFNPQLCKDQRKAREAALAHLKDDILPEFNRELTGATKSRSQATTQAKLEKVIRKMKLSAFTEITLSEITVKEKIRTFQASISIDPNSKLHTGRLDGFWLLVTNHNEKNSNGDYIQSTAEILKPYREKVVIEDAFRHIKSFVNISPVHVWLEQHVKAHYTICVLAWLINKTIQLRLQENPEEGILSAETVYRELKSCTIDQISTGIDERKIHCMTELNSRQQTILKKLGIDLSSSAKRILQTAHQKQDSGQISL